MAEQPINVSYLLAVWGKNYIDQFMDLSLRSLLAPNNIPALSHATKSKFIFLTRASDRELFAAHPMFSRLEVFCRVEFITIDDLIFDGNYSATLTLAYERGMRSAGKAMLSTYFIYLVADYIMADGSLANLLPYMQRGVSGITAGNFQVTEEDMKGKFKAQINKTTGVLSIPPRELVALSLPHLHPLTAANIVNQNFSHTDHTNRLFWRAGDDALVGRFYLRHMLCIKPEIDNYIIGASCDYSYIVEMCPSGNVAHLADSDEYCVVELQPFAQELKFIKNGAPEQRQMVKSLSEWVTRAHRDNIFIPVIYHANDISAEVKKMVDESHAFVERIEQQLPTTSQAVRGHPYWISCIEGILENLMLLNNQEDYFKRNVFAGIIGSPTFEPPLGAGSIDYNLLKTTHFQYGLSWRRRLLAIVHRIFGSEAHCTFWHREYTHSRAIKKTLRQAATNAEHFLVIAFEPTGYAEWCHTTFSNQAVLQKYELFDLRATAALQEQARGASHAVILLSTNHLHLLGKTIAKCIACLIGEKKITVIITERNFSLRHKPFKEKLAPLSGVLGGMGVQIDSFTTITGVLRRGLDGIFERVMNIFLQRSLSPLSMLKRLIAFPIFILTCAGYTLNNLFSRRRKYPHLSNATCAIIQLRIKP